MLGMTTFDKAKEKVPFLANIKIFTLISGKKKHNARCKALLSTQNSHQAMHTGTSKGLLIRPHCKFRLHHASFKVSMIEGQF